jgi:hypothetical protein
VRLEDLIDETCGWCRKPYEQSRLSQKFCCAECRRASDIHFWTGIRKEERRRANSGKTCPSCRRVFDAAHGKQVYCSLTCRQIEVNRRSSAKVTAQRKAVRMNMKCVDCSGPIPHVRRNDAKRCKSCLKVWTREIGRKHDAKRRQLL